MTGGATPVARGAPETVVTEKGAPCCSCSAAGLGGAPGMGLGAPIVLLIEPPPADCNDDRDNGNDEREVPREAALWRAPRAPVGSAGEWGAPTAASCKDPMLGAPWEGPPAVAAKEGEDRCNIRTGAAEAAPPTDTGAPPAAMPVGPGVRGPPEASNCISAGVY